MKVNVPYLLNLVHIFKALSCDDSVMCDNELMCDDSLMCDDGLKCNDDLMYGDGLMCNDEMCDDATACRRQPGDDGPSDVRRWPNL